MHKQIEKLHIYMLPHHDVTINLPNSTTFFIKFKMKTNPKDCIKLNEEHALAFCSKLTVFLNNFKHNNHGREQRTRLSNVR